MSLNLIEADSTKDDSNSRGDTMITDPHRILLFHCHPCPEGVYEGRRTGGEAPEVYCYLDLSATIQEDLG